jgi:hypothetical protein
MSRLGRNLFQSYTLFTMTIRNPLHLGPFNLSFMIPSPRPLCWRPPARPRPSSRFPVFAAGLRASTSNAHRRRRTLAHPDCQGQRLNQAAPYEPKKSAMTVLASGGPRDFQTNRLLPASTMIRNVQERAALALQIDEAREFNTAPLGAG